MIMIIKHSHSQTVDKLTPKIFPVRRYSFHYPLKSAKACSELTLIFNQPDEIGNISGKSDSQRFILYSVLQLAEEILLKQRRRMSQLISQFSCCHAKSLQNSKLFSSVIIY